jgi:hypothetical protein
MNMQWFRRSPSESPEHFWEETAKKRGGDVGFFTFATLLGRSSDTPLNFPGLLYFVGETVWFEDFERDNWLSRILGGRNKYQKTEISFSRADIRFTRMVSRGNAARCIGGGAEPEKLPAASFFTRLLSTPVIELGMSDGTALFFEIMMRREFFAALKK